MTPRDDESSLAETTNGASLLEGAARNARGGDMSAVWRDYLKALRGTIRKEQFETWFRRAALRSVDDGRLVLVVQNAFARDWLSNNY
ncbi:MAG TPA: DnaA N-terminal domain-containing protein, partial [Planctomycetota bacterium]|nr:DnaA N-terminal domain-containing protein [Planctomycetota bacterium]